MEDQDQESQPVKTYEINVSIPNQLKQSQLSTLLKSYAQVVKKSPMRLVSEKLWTEVKYGNRKDEMTKKKLQKQESGGKKILFSRVKDHEKMFEEDIILALNKTF